jgi:hypothetical protein
MEKVIRKYASLSEIELYSSRLVFLDRFNVLTINICEKPDTSERSR